MKTLSPERPVLDGNDLVSRIAQQDREAFAELFVLAAPRVKSYLLRLGALPAEAEELTQDVMVKVWRKASQFDVSRANAFTWIFVIARNRRIDAMRNRAAAALIYGDDAAPEAIDEGCSPLDAAMLVEHSTHLQAALKKLPEEQHEVVRRSYLQEQPHSEIAAALGLPLGTVKSRLRLAMEKLRVLMEAK